MSIEDKPQSRLFSFILSIGAMPMEATLTHWHIFEWWKLAQIGLHAMSTLRGKKTKISTGGTDNPWKKLKKIHTIATSKYQIVYRMGLVEL